MAWPLCTKVWQHLWPADFIDDAISFRHAAACVRPSLVELDNFRCVHYILHFPADEPCGAPSLAVTGSTTMKTMGQLFPYFRFFGYLFLGLDYLNHTVVSVLGFVLWNHHTGSVEQLLNFIVPPRGYQDSNFSTSSPAITVFSGFEFCFCFTESHYFDD